jgi:hypothetical protein
VVEQADVSPTRPETPRWLAWLAKWQAVVVAALLAAFFLQVILSMRLLSVTVDWVKGDFSVYRRNPPLTKMWAALPLFRSSLDKEFTNCRNHWSAGYALMLGNEAMYQTLYVRCRAMIAVLGVALGYLVFRWSRDLFGVAAGVLSLAVYAFSPNFIAYSGLITSDVGAAGTYALACYALFKLDEKWSVWRLLFAGFAFGLAMLAKFSCLALVMLAPLVLVLAALTRRGGADGTRPGWRRELGRGAATLGLIALGCVLIVNAGYGFDGSFKKWGDYANEAGPVGLLGSSCLSRLPAPFPEQFLRGFAEQDRASFEEGQFTYLHGAVSYEAWWYYFAVVFLLKVPLATLALAGLAVYAGVRRFDRRAFVFVVVPALFFFAVFSTKLLRIRWQLPALALMFVGIGALLRRDAPAPLGRPAWRAAVGVLVAWLVVESAVAFPNYIAYFNELAGGHGERFLVDTNCDWGQDLIALRRFARRHGIEHLHLATLGRVDAQVYGVQYETLRPREPVTGDVVISVSLLAGHPYCTPDNGHVAIKVPRDGYAWLRTHTPVCRIGGSLYYFRIEPKPDEPQATHGRNSS